MNCVTKQLSNQLQVRRRLDGPVMIVSSSLVVFIVLLFAGFITVLTASAATQRTCDKTRTIVDGKWGVISDDLYPYTTINYTQNTHCEWLIQPNRSREGLQDDEKYFISLVFSQMSTECAYDYLFVYDGHSPSQWTLLGSFSGRTKPPKLLARSGSMTAILFSDTNYVLEGFRAEYSVTACPHNCTRHGTCQQNVCICDKGWTGDDCSLQVCSENCGQTSGRGTCVGNADGLSGQCKCNPGFSGEDCSLDQNNFIGNTWHYLSRQANSPFTSRTSHSSVYYESQDCLFVYGGYDLNKILDDFLVYKFEESHWKVFDFQKEEFVLPKSVDETMSHNESHGQLRPPPLYGHAMENVPTGFVIFGGLTTDGTPSNQLWLFDVSESQFKLVASESEWQPPPLSDHSLTLAEGFLYAFGGSTDHGKFSSKMFRINATELKSWEPIEARGTKVSDLRVTGHTMVYSPQFRHLILYGGIHTDVARFSKLSDQMFIFSLDSMNWAELDQARRPRPFIANSHVPAERAFHTAKIIGSYMIVFGGYSHQHNDVEACHDDKLYFFHLGCHVWVSERVLEHSPHGRRYPKHFGLFGHSVAVRKSNTLIISGGFSGSVSSDVLAYIFPLALAVPDSDNLCTHYGSQASCSANPECGWCPSDGICYLRTLTGKCASNLQTTSCPGICPGLKDCLSCTIHGNGSYTGSVIVDTLGLTQCTWCSHMSRCMPQMAPHVCIKQENTWWTDAIKINSPDDCYTNDFTPGMTLLKYYNAPNFSYPDEVSIVNVTDVEFRPVNRQGIIGASGSGKFAVRLLGSVRVPSDAGKRTFPTERLSFCVNYASILLKASHSNESPLQLIQNSWSPDRQSVCPDFLRWPEDETPFFLFPGGNFKIDLLAERNASSPNHLPGKASTMVLKSSRGGQNLADAQALTKDYLEPYKDGKNCPQQDNCLACTSDLKCGWCGVTGRCVTRDTMKSECGQHLTLTPSQCVNCSSHIYCEECVNGGAETENGPSDGQCEWLKEEARCVRRGRFEDAVRTLSSCPTPCHTRQNCSTCVGQPGRCVWCEDKEECFLFSVYTSSYKYGSCKHWIDKDFSVTSSTLDSSHDEEGQVRVDGQCATCEHLKNCSTCLQRLGCGWCYDPSNPTIGKCMKGGFGGSVDRCLAENPSDPIRQWDYATCPDIDECSLDLHDCHENATCTNKKGSFECSCNKGFIGDGKKFCDRTCFDECVHGKCSQGPDFKCICDIGWTGPDCTIDCGCHGHSTCSRGVGLCDECLDNSTGNTCEICQVGSFGNATNPDQGCSPCKCNQHEDLSAGICDRETGNCFCLDHTEGENCQKCTKGFYGDPRQGGSCYHDCSARRIIQHEREGHLGSYSLRILEQKENKNKNEQDQIPLKKCLWIISPKNFSLQKGPTFMPEDQSIIQLRFEETLSVSCIGSQVQVFDGLPKFVSDTWSTKSKLLGAFCGDQKVDAIVEAQSGVMSIYYEDDGGAGFNASFTIQNCPYHCSDTKRRCDTNGGCVCKEGFGGKSCSRVICPNKCGKTEGRGSCIQETGICKCYDGYSGEDCSRITNIDEGEYQDLDMLETPHSPLPRFGGSLLADRRGTLWIFGGFSPATGIALNDVRAFDTKIGTWLPVTIQHEDSSPPELPPGRVFHASAFLQDNVYVYGGLTDGSRYLQDFWKFNTLTRTWEKVVYQLGKKLAGHTMTVNDDEKTLVIIGGISDQSGFNHLVYEYIPSKNLWHIIPTKGYHAPLIGLYGHTTVYNPSHKAFYVFGGLAFDPEFGVQASRKLFSLHYPSGKWALIPVRADRSKRAFAQARFFHSAVATKKFMMVFGGLDGLDLENHKKPTEKKTLHPTAIYVFRCSLWIDIAQDSTEIKFHGPPPEVSLGSAATLADDSEIYILDGFLGQFEVTLKKLAIETDFCKLTTNNCESMPGCSRVVMVEDGGNNTTFCYSNDFSNPVVSPCKSCSFHYKNGISCSGADLYELRDCSEHKTCGECTSDFPMPEGSRNGARSSICKWCAGCSKGKCIPSEFDCSSEQLCTLKLAEIKEPARCPDMICAASDCEKCGDSACTWTRSVQRVGEQARVVSQVPIYDWTCESKVLFEKVNKTLGLTGNMSNQICPLKCHYYDNCKDCLSSKGADGGWKECRWSENFGCTSPNDLPLRCVAGLCGRILAGNPGLCPVPCSSHTKCSSCLEDPGCGWCALDSEETTGIGVCIGGTLEGPQVGHCDLANFTSVIFPAGDGANRLWMKQPTRSSLLQTSWHYLTCPIEDECQNGHDNCDPRSEICIDTQEGFNCDCNDGYKRMDGDTSSPCKPVCNSCVHGDCIRPGECRCHFSFVGESCDTACQCNNHSDCAGIDKLNVCLSCQNNTVGDQCEFCLPFYVGDPRNGTSCKSCFEYCNGHTDQCFDSDTFNASTISQGSDLLNVGLDVESFHNVTTGPISEAICVNCGHMTFGNKCERCIAGHYRSGPSQDSPCLPCDCNGHGNTCDETTGGECLCQNNTVTDPDYCSRRKGNQEAGSCHQFQCTKCKEYYIGSPEKNHQCYRQMSVDTEYCFDPITQSECTRGPRPLPSGDSVFFAVLPKFMNVDIRVVIDVTIGEVDIIFSPEPQLLVVEANSSTKTHKILIDSNFNILLLDDNFVASRQLLPQPKSKSDNSEDPNQDNSDSTIEEIDDEDDYDVAPPIDHLDDGPKFQPPFFGHLDDFSSLSALLRFHRQQRRTGKKNLVAQLAANASLFPVGGSSRHQRRHRQYLMVSHECDDRLGTYIRLNDPATVLHVTKLKNRLVISLPEAKHDLRTTRFFMAIRGASNTTKVRLEKRSVLDAEGYSYGSIYFRQDQLHIDLFVFFSVFFSCFFLFLSACVLIWKLKAESDLRQARRRHAVEMQHMARRPFATQAVLLGGQSRSQEVMLVKYRQSFKKSCSVKPDQSNKSAAHQRLLMYTNTVGDASNNRAVDVEDMVVAKPLAVEPTGDAMAAVSTFLVEMPVCAALQRANGQSLLSFGCVLVSGVGKNSQTILPPQKNSRRRQLSDGSNGMSDS